MLRRFLAAAFALVALHAQAPPAAAQVVGTMGAPLLGRAPCAGAVLKVDFVNGLYCLNGASYGGLASLPNISIARAGPGYVQRVDGTLVLVGSNVARISDRGLLIEQARTTLALWSEDFTNGVWSTSSATVTADQTTAPNNAVTADLIVEAAATTQHRTIQSITVSNTTSYTWCVFAKAKERAAVELKFNTGGSNLAQSAFNLSAGTVTNTASGSASIAAAALGFYRVCVTATSDGTAFQGNVALLQNATDTTASESYAGNGTSGLYVWGASLEASSFAGSYKPTTTASVTLPADIISLSGLSVPPPYTFLGSVTFAAPNDSTDLMLGNNGNDGALIYEASLSVRAVLNEGGVATANLAAGSVVSGRAFKFGARFAVNDTGGAVAGQSGTHDTSNTPPTLTAIGFGRGLYAFGTATNLYFGGFAIYPTAYNDGQLQAATQ